MFLLIVFAFLAGVVTILSPCILPILPIVLSSSIGSGKRKPFGVVAGFVLSFTFFTLFLSTIVKATGISADSLRFMSVIIIAGFGLSFLIPALQILLEKLFSKLSNNLPKAQGKDGFFGGVIIGLTLGLLWTPCVGPILASVISLALSGSVTGSAFFITLAYSLGTAIPMFIVMYGGRELLNKNQWLLKNTKNIQKVFGVLMIVTAIAIHFNIDRQFQTYILEKFPQYGAGLTKFEDNEMIKKRLEGLGNENKNKKNLFNLNGLSDDLGQAPALIEGGKWFNLPNGEKTLILKKLRGKVVLIDFWTYTCINCIRTMPYLRAWHEKYKDQGLVIIGVHTPEFEFEKNPDNLQKAINDFKLTYPIMQDNDFATWKAYENRYWPAKYLIDKDGTVRYTHFGEGEYDETEKIIQELLKETGKKLEGSTISNPQYELSAKTPELYLGSSRIEYLTSPEQIVPQSKTKFSAPAALASNTFAFEGFWTVSEEFAAPFAGSSLLVNFESKEVFLVMRPQTKSSQIRVYLDDKIVEANSAGDDVVKGIVTVDKDRLYKLIKLDKAGRHTLKLEFLDNNAELFAFTFG